MDATAFRSTKNVARILAPLLFAAACSTFGDCGEL